MAISMYQASAPRFVHMLTALAAILDKAQAHAEARKFDPAALTEARLYPDMFPMKRQVQIACDLAKGGVARLAGVEVPKHEDTEQTFADLKARIAKTVDFIQSVKASQVDGSEDRPIALRIGGQDLKFTGLEYLLGFVVPNFYFHLTTAYAILRHNGVEVGKYDYLGARR